MKTLCNSNNMSDTVLVNSWLCLCFLCLTVFCMIWRSIFALNLYPCYAVSLWCLFLLKMSLAQIYQQMTKTFLLEDLSSNLHFLLWSNLNFLMRSAVTAVLELEGRRKSESKRTFGDRRRNGRRNKPRCSRVHQTISLVTCVTLATYNLLRYPYN